MNQSDYQNFAGLMRDLCAAFNRPLNDDLVRVFWDALRDYPLHAIRGKVRMATLGKKFPAPIELKPEHAVSVGRKEPTTQELLCDFVLRTRNLTDAQLRMPWIYTHDRSGNVTGVIVQADGDWPGYNVRTEDMQLEAVA